MTEVLGESSLTILRPGPIDQATDPAGVPLLVRCLPRGGVVVSGTSTLSTSHRDESRPDDGVEAATALIS